MLKLYVYGYLHQLTSSRKLEREAGRNIELMCLIGKLARRKEMQRFFDLDQRYGDLLA